MVLFKIYEKSIFYDLEGRSQKWDRGSERVGVLYNALLNKHAIFLTFAFVILQYLLCVVMGTLRLSDMRFGFLACYKRAVSGTGVIGLGIDGCLPVI